MIERYIEPEGPDKGRINNIEIAMDLAYTEDAWRKEPGGVPMNQPSERLGEPEVRFRELINSELSRLVLEGITSETKKELDEIYDTKDARQADAEEKNEEWLRYRMVNYLLSLGEDSGFDTQTCYDLLDVSFPEAFETAYGYLIQAGLDADAILADYME